MSLEEEAEAAPLADLAVLDALLPITLAEEDCAEDAGGDAVSVDDVLQQFDAVTVLPDADIPSRGTFSEDATLPEQSEPVSLEEGLSPVAEVATGSVEPDWPPTATESFDILGEDTAVLDSDQNEAASSQMDATSQDKPESVAGIDVPLPAEEDSPGRPPPSLPAADLELTSPETPPPLEEELVLSPPSEPLDAMPPPAPTAPLFIGSLVTEKDATADEDSDSDDEADDGDVSPPPPLNIPAANDDEDELEVDPEVSKEIQSAARRESTPRQPERQENALLAASESPTPPTEFSTVEPGVDNDDIQLSVLEDDTTSARRAPHPESSEGVFGIAYKSLKKTQRRDTGAVKDTFSVGAGFADLESELTLSSDASLGRSRVTSRQGDEGLAGDDDDEFATDAGATSPTRVNAFLEKLPTRRQHTDDTDRDMVVEMKRATEAERSQLAGEGTAMASSEKEADNGITLKELHSIYKRGLGDQEVRLMEEEEADEDKQVMETIKKEKQEEVNRRGKSEAEPALSVMGRLLNSTGVRSAPIAEEDGEDEDDRGSLSASEPQEEDDRLQLVDNSGAESGNRSDPPPASEWLEIQLLRKASTSQLKAEPEDDRSEGLRPPSPSAAVTRISYASALEFVLEDESLLDVRDRIVVEDLAAPTSCFSCFSRPRLAFPEAAHERERLFCAAATAFDARNSTFVAMLQTIFRQLTRAPRDVPLSGTHWEQIGFQGNDPATDLRGCGVLSLLQMLFLVERHEELAQRCLRASHHATRHFPLACALINVTLQCLLALRSGALFKECNAQRSVFQGANALFIALTTQLVEALETSTEQIPFVMKRVLDHGRQHPDKVLDAVFGPQHSVDGQPSKSAAGSGQGSAALSGPAARRKSSAAHASSHAEFSEIALHSVEE
ncbi:hypothetical protein P43SY_007682 [Pythium insidiosum]|uniref:ELMO domain-containing protein n=1 Tax=Pythium insidiosum TaxID=114742 RepID=A0AAD5LXE6_PYTIN|nr:hypothetical protein P43SY_007682 [Pythium insidiosum]